jgi:rod shape-determining protein MreB
MEESNDTLCVGIDLGTSRSSISASSGERHVIDSYVGWPMDMVARKLVKKSVLVGRDALDNRPMLDLRRPLERGIMKEGSEKDQEAVQEILRHLIGLAGVKPKSKNKVKVRAVVGVPAEAFRVNRQNLRSTMEGIADSVMLVSEPFAVAYGLEALLHALVIDIDEQLMKLIRERHPDAQFSIHMLRDWKEKWSFVGEPKQRVIVSAPIKGKATEIDITQEMRTACESILPPICETMTTLLAKVEPEFQAKVRNNVILAGGTSLIAGLADAITHALSDLGGGRATVVKDPVFAGSDGSLAIAQDASSSDWEKLSL